MIVVLLAWIPLCWEPLRGQAPGVGEDVAQKPKQNTKLATPQPQIGTEASPLVVETHTSTKSEQEAAEAKADKEHASRVEGWMLFFTGAAALFTGLLVFVGWQGVDAAKRTLLAIEKQVGIMVDSERAWVIVPKPHAPELSPITPGAIRPYNTFRFDIINKGRTVAKLVELNGEYRIIDKNATLPEQPVYPPVPISALGFAHGSVLVPDDSIQNLIIGIDERLDDAKFNDIRNDALTLYVYGYLKYFDFAKVERKIQFCYLYVNRGASWKEYPDGVGQLNYKAQWMIAGPPDYNTHT